MADERAPSKTGRRRGWVLALPFLVFAGLAGIFAVLLLDGRDAGELPSALVGKPAPQFDLPPLEGLRDATGAPVPGAASTGLGESGKPVLVNIFASWCVPCRAEHPILMALSERGDLSMVGINYKDETENARRFLGALGNPYDRVGVDPNGRAAIDWGFYGIPETFLIDRQGRVRHKVVGPLTRERLTELEAAIDGLARPSGS